MPQLQRAGVLVRGASATDGGRGFKYWSAESKDMTGMTLLQAIPLIGNKAASSAYITQVCLMRIER